MADISFAIQILSTTLALSAAYALVMTALKRELQYAWLQSETLITLFFTALALSFAFGISVLTYSTLLIISFALLAFALIATLTLVCFNRFSIKNDPKIQKKHTYAKLLSVSIFAALLLHLLLEFAAIAWS